MQKRGFTLIELLVVIAIVSILLSIVVVALMQSRQQAKIVAAKAEVAQIMRAATIVYTEYGYYPSDSHGSLICPRDIVIDSSGRKWGDYISVCEDPWGNPYVWDNHCADGTPRKHDNLGNCSTFDDDVNGVIGVTVTGPDGIESACTGDDLCAGQRGHVTYGWDGNTVPAAPVGPQCTTQTADCSSLSIALCTSRSGCSVVEGGCAGTYNADTSCSSFASQSTCTAQTGCAWGNQSCSGSRPACTTYGSSSTCNASSGCSWSVTGGTCGGTVTCSAYVSSQSTCQGKGCTWTAATCGGTYACSQWNATNSATCTTGHPGCTWSSAQGGKCNGGSLSCSSFVQSSCTPTGCSWGTNNCTGSPSCSTYSSQASCTPTGCSWTNSSSCTGTATACTTYSNSSACSAGGCTWGGGSCSGTYSTSANCSILNTQSTCSAQSGCNWSGQSCSGTAASCSGFTSQTSCGAQAGCSWQ